MERTQEAPLTTARSAYKTARYYAEHALECAARGFSRDAAACATFAYRWGRTAQSLGVRPSRRRS